MASVGGTPLTPSLARAYRVGRTIPLIDGPVRLVDTGGATLELSGELIASDGALEIVGNTSIHLTSSGSITIEPVGDLNLSTVSDILANADGDIIWNVNSAAKTGQIVHPTAGTIALRDPTVDGVGLVLLGDPAGGAGALPVPFIGFVPIGTTIPSIGGTPSPGSGPSILVSSPSQFRGDLNGGDLLEVFDTVGSAGGVGMPSWLLLHGAGAVPPAVQHFLGIASFNTGAGLVIHQPALGDEPLFSPSGTFPVNTNVISLGNAFGGAPDPQHINLAGSGGSLILATQGFGPFDWDTAPTYPDPLLWLAPPGGAGDPWLTVIGSPIGGGGNDRFPSLFLSTSSAAGPIATMGTVPTTGKAITASVRAGLVGGSGTVAGALHLGKKPSPALDDVEILVGGQVLLDESVGTLRIGSDPASAPGTLYGRPLSVQAINSLSLGWGKGAGAVRTFAELIAQTSGTSKMPYLKIQSLSGKDNYLWVDDTGGAGVSTLRIGTTAPTDATDTGGTVVGTQT